MADLTDKQFGNYNPQELEKKWAKEWEDKELYVVPQDDTSEDVNEEAERTYVLPQLPYPSGSGLHVGHAEGYTACDIYARYQRMIGKSVMQVIGWDSFGLPAEGYAVKHNVHPKITTEQNIENFIDQIQKMGISVDWEREVGSHRPDYYKFTQWFFLLMYNQGLAYRAKQKTNWCPSCKTVLANDQVKEGNCERCDTEVVQKMKEVWYLKITDYAKELYEDLDLVDWPQESMKRQRDWIGISNGCLIDFKLFAKGQVPEESDMVQKVKAFTTRPDTIFGATFLTIAPEHEVLREMKGDIKNWDEVEDYLKQSSNKTDLERKQDKNKTGVRLEGIWALNPVNSKRIPVFVSDFVLMDYGTGAIMSVPAHDERDYEFAEKFDLDIIPVIKPEGELEEEEVYTGPGKMINSGKYSGMGSEEFKDKICDWFEQKGMGKRTEMMKLRDWSVSRQRFWGAPVPMMHKPLTKQEKKLNEAYQAKPDRAVQLHAWGSNPDAHFHPWLHDKLRRQGVNSLIPELPEADMPQIDKWKEVAEEALGDESDNTVVVTRSLSSMTALKVAEEKRLRKLIMLCPVLPSEVQDKKEDELFEDGIMDEKQHELLKGWVDQELDTEAIRENVGQLVFVLSSNDPYIPFEETEAWIHQNFPFARVMRVREAGHFDADNGYEEFPELLEEIQKPVELGLVRVRPNDLPVKLPDDVDFKPTGQSPLTYSKEFQKGVEETYGEDWKREVDTLDTFMCSSWYYYRYLDPHNEAEFASEESLEKWMPVDFYIGGPEHVTGHLLYSRFFTKVLYDAGYIDFKEPFMFHRHQGLILGPDNRKMSKRWGNVINPNEVVKRSGADTLRLYEMFMGPLEDTKAWNEDGEKGVRRFLDRVWDLQNKVKEDINKNDLKEQKIEIDKLVKYTTQAIPDLKFNTNISKFMEFTNFLGDQEYVDSAVWTKFVKIFAPYAPFICEELWSNLGNSESVHMGDWPKFDPELIQQDTVELPVQINGKTRGKVYVAMEANEEEVIEAVKENDRIMKYIEDKKDMSNRVIYVKGKIINFVT